MYCFMDQNAGVSPRKIWQELNHSITDASDESAVYFGQTRSLPKNLYGKTKCQSVVSEIKHRRIAMAWTCAEDGPIPYPQNRLEMDFTWKRKPGRLKSTWRRTVEAELKELNISCRANKVHSKGQEHMERNQGSLMSQQGKEDNSSKRFGFSF